MININTIVHNPNCSDTGRMALNNLYNGKATLEQFEKTIAVWSLDFLTDYKYRANRKGHVNRANLDWLSHVSKLIKGDAQSQSLVQSAINTHIYKLDK